MKVGTILLGLFFLLKFNDSVGQTCDQIQYTTINDVRRSTKYKGKPGSLLCDRNYIQDDKWYRFDSVAGNKMPTQNPGTGFCGTYAPIWMKGTHPTTDNVVKDATACGAAPFVFPLGCGYSYAIKVIKCGKFFLYRLKEPQLCSLAYCAGDQLQNTKCSPTGETLPVCPGTIPRLTVGADFKSEESEVIRLRCFWNSPGNVTNIEYQARWFGDVNDPNPKLQANFTGLDTELLFEHTLFKNEPKNTGYEYDKNVYCTVRARYKTGSWSKWVPSRRIYTGMEVTPTFIPLINDCGNKDREVIVTLRPHLPIRVKPVNVDIASPRNYKLIDEICVVGDAIGFQICGMVFQPDHRVGQPMRFKLMANCATGNRAATLNATYQLQHHIQHLDMINRFWINYKFPEIKIRKAHFTKKQCQSSGDPHFRTFDGKTYNFFGRGTFLFYKNTLYGTEIHVRQRACNGATPSCNCGIAIKENLFYKIYDMCYVDPSQPWWHNNLRSRLRIHQLRDFKLSRFYTKVSQQGSTSKFEITLPSGVKVIVNRQSWGLNLEVWAPQDPRNRSQGLCGNNNGDPDDDFGGWHSANDFGENQRIHTHLSNFDYKGSKFDEDQLDDGCNKKICVCSEKNGKYCGQQAENVCFPSLTDTGASRAHHQGSGIGECPNRPKRAVTLEDDTVDDQDEIPAFNPTVTRVNVTLTWPTASGLTKENVTQYCERKLRYSKAGAACGQVDGVDVDGLVQQCITDIQATEDFSWAAGNFAALQTSCVANIFNNISSFKNTTDGSIELETDVLMSVCPNDCSDNGDCTNSTCTCHEDFTAADCSISLKESPTVFDIRKSGLCDRRRRPCRNVGIFGFPLLDSENLTCHVKEFKVIDSVWSPSNSITLYRGQQTDLTEVKCSLPESPVNIGDYGNEGVTAAGLRIAVSNNGINASTDSMVFITYDSVCQECNTTTIKCRLRTDACFISGHCFAKNDSKPDDWCQQCLPEFSTTTWSERRDNQPPVFVTSSVFYAFKGKELRVQLNANDPENRTMLYSFAQNETFGALLNKNGSFVWTKNTNASSTFIFKVTDECGAYSTLNVSVVIKKCPCQNLGECFPDHRVMDGTGSFTCACTSEYTGALCELDANECNVSSPCFNGSCINQQPGFSCSCFNGYTGRLCETEINECESNPCFLSVACIHMIAGYRCGQCPSGYTGNGKNCSRIDGNVDECLKDPQVCHKNAKCGYSNGSYVCQCTQGYVGDGKNCTDIDECQQSPCHSLATCLNTEGSYSCQCNNGYTGNGKMDCKDVDECQQSPCHSMAICSNTEGTFSCQCRDGLTGDGKANCTDIDECKQSPCHLYATCRNILQSYSCKCNQGYFGDGIRNCTENQPPHFSTPDSLHGMFNMLLRVQIRAKDPEGQSIMFTLLQNGTISLAKAKITKQGLLEINLGEQIGTVFIQAMDEMGAKSTLILHVNATRCPCEHNGTCYKKNTILYPVKAPDYLCQCEEPYTGDLCEIHPNPCNEESCFPGLECTAAQNADGFTCEDCPPSFEGDGKNCKLDKSKVKDTVKTTITLTNERWNEKLAKKTSKEYKSLVSRIIAELRSVYKTTTGFAYVIIKNLRKGSVKVDFELIFTKKMENPLEPLKEVAKTGKIGNMTFEIEKADDKDDSSDKILGLDQTVFIVIVVTVVAFILIIVIAVCVRQRHMRRTGDAKLNKYQPSITAYHEGVALNEGQKGEGTEEIDLEVIDNEAVCTKEEITLQP